MAESGKTPEKRYGVVILVSILSLSLAMATQWAFKARHQDWTHVPGVTGDLKDAFFQAIPRPLRTLGADLCWVTADEYMHFGGSKKISQQFLAGSYAGNTELLPFLELAITLDPSFFMVYELLAQNLSMYLERFKDGIRVLQQGILANQRDPQVHELYGTIGFFHYFVGKYTTKVKKNPRVSMLYLDAAVRAYEQNGKPTIDNPPLGPRFYHFVRARLFVENGQPQAALAAWRLSGDSLEASDDLLGAYLRKVARGEPVPPLPEDLPEAAGMAKSGIAAMIDEKLMKEHSCKDPGCAHKGPKHSHDTQDRAPSPPPSVAETTIPPEPGTIIPQASTPETTTKVGSATNLPSTEVAPLQRHQRSPISVRLTWYIACYLAVLSWLWISKRRSFSF
jgi:hypothetical protein